MSHGKLLTAKEVAKLVGFTSPVTVLRAYRAGKLKGYKLSERTLRFRLEQVEQWIGGPVGEAPAPPLAKWTQRKQVTDWEFEA